MPCYTDSAEFVSPKQESCSYLDTIHTNSATKKRKSSADQRQLLRSRTSPQLTPNIDRPGTASLTPGLAPICSGRLRKGHRGVSPVTLDPS